jgi:hypothetical protein
MILALAQQLLILSVLYLLIAAPLSRQSCAGIACSGELPPAYEKCESREEELGMMHHNFNMVLCGMAGYTLASAIVAGFWGVRALRFRQAEVKASSLEPVIRGWLNNSDLSTKSVSNPSWNFGFLTTLPNGEPIQIMQMKEHPGFIAFQADLAISTEHQAILKAMPRIYFDKLAQEIVLGVFLANVALAIRTRLSGVSFFSKLAITTGLTEKDLLQHLYDINYAITLARKAISLGAARAPRLVAPRNIRVSQP